MWRKTNQPPWCKFHPFLSIRPLFCSCADMPPSLSMVFPGNTVPRQAGEGEAAWHVDFHASGALDELAIVIHLLDGAINGQFDVHALNCLWILVEHNEVGVLDDHVTIEHCYCLVSQETSQLDLQGVSGGVQGHLLKAMCNVDD